MMERIQINDSAPRGTFLCPFPRHCDTPLYVIASVARQSSAFPAETGLPRFLAEPRSDGDVPSPRRQDCRGSLRNLAMTGTGLPRGDWIALPCFRSARNDSETLFPSGIACVFLRHCEAARRSNPVHTSPETGLPRFLAEPRNDSKNKERIAAFSRGIPR